MQLDNLALVLTPLLTYSTHAVPPPEEGILSIDFAKSDDRIHML